LAVMIAGCRMTEENARPFRAALAQPPAADGEDAGADESRAPAKVRSLSCMLSRTWLNVPSLDSFLLQICAAVAASPVAQDLLSRMLQFLPAKRSSAADLLARPFFQH